MLNLWQLTRPSQYSQVGRQRLRTSRARSCWYGLTREIGWLNREIGPKTARAHNKSCPAALWDGPACRCSNFFGGNFVAAPDIAQNSAAPARVEFCPITGAAHARAASATSTPCPPTLTSRPSFVVTVFLHMRPRRDGRELSCREKDSRRRTKFGREGAGTFQCPRPLYIGRNLTYPVPWHLSMPRAGPCKAPRHEPACRTTGLGTR